MNTACVCACVWVLYDYLKAARSATGSYTHSTRSALSTSLIFTHNSNKEIQKSRLKNQLLEAEFQN